MLESPEILLKKAKLEVEVAENHLNWASTPEDVDICIYRLASAEKYLDKVIKLAKDCSLQKNVSYSENLTDSARSLPPL